MSINITPIYISSITPIYIVRIDVIWRPMRKAIITTPMRKAMIFKWWWRGCVLPHWFVQIHRTRTRSDCQNPGMHHQLGCVVVHTGKWRWWQQVGRRCLTELLVMEEDLDGMDCVTLGTGVFYLAVAMAGFGFDFLVLHYVVLEELFSFRSARHLRKNPSLSPLPTASSPTLTPTMTDCPSPSRNSRGSSISVWLCAEFFSKP